MDISKNNLLSRTSFGILLALSLKPRHGYELIQQIDHDTNGRLRLGPGALYGTIRQLHDDGLIEEMPFTAEERRRYYRLTKKGWNRLSAEMQYYEQTVRLAQERRVISRTLEGIRWAV